MYCQRTTVGLDVHARSIVAEAIDWQTGECSSARFLHPELDRVWTWLAALPAPALVGYEAGPSGFGLARQLKERGYDGVVLAPSRLPRSPGERVKTDARDARKLAEALHAMHHPPAVYVPTPEQEGARDLTRAREVARAELLRARQQVGKMALRHGHLYTGGVTWTGKHRDWLRRLRLPDPCSQLAFEDYQGAEHTALARLARLDVAITALAAQPAWAGQVTRLATLRGIDTLTAMSLAAEIGDWHRLTGANIGAFLGLTPGEHSSGQTRRQTSITKTGNSRARRLLIEAAWHQRKPLRAAGRALTARRAAAGPAAVARARQAETRLHAQWARFDAAGKKPVIANTAIARELAGWCWSLATLQD